MYTFGIHFYIFILRIISPFHPKAKLMISGRKRWYERLEKVVDKDASYIWFHCSSLGEFEQGRPLIEAHKAKHPTKKIILSFFSPSGYEIRKNYDGADIVCYIPFDTAKNASRFIELVNPEKVFFVKYEYWYYFLTQLKSKNIPTYLVSAIFRENQIFFKGYGRWFRKILSSFTTIFVQDNDSKTLLSTINFSNVIVAGDTRFDRVADVVKLKKRIPVVEPFIGKSKIIIAGSSWPADEDLLCDYINQSSEDVKFIIAPHEVHESHIQNIQEKLNVSYVTYTKIRESSSKVADVKVLIIDTIGILSSLYQYGDIAYIGGGFGVGIHNTLEAATYGMPVIFGPNYKKFREAVQLISCGGAFSITSYENLSKKLDQLLYDMNYCQSSGRKAGQYVIENTGASEMILNHIKA